MGRAARWRRHWRSCRYPPWSSWTVLWAGPSRRSSAPAALARLFNGSSTVQAVLFGFAEQQVFPLPCDMQCASCLASAGWASSELYQLNSCTLVEDEWVVGCCCRCCPMWGSDTANVCRVDMVLVGAEGVLESGKQPPKCFCLLPEGRRSWHAVRAATATHFCARLWQHIFASTARQQHHER